MNKKPELVAPAGNWSSLVTAVENGADAVYFGVKDLNMRNLATNFAVSQIKKVMNFLHKNKKKGYLALNVVVMNKDLSKVKKILKEAKSTKVNAVILWDMSVFALAKQLGLRIHLSTQASVANEEALDFYHRLGARRIILARECTLSDIRQITRYIKQNKIRCEIEAFIHGAMCVSISGRCFLSHYSFGKSANKGQCLQPCRREFVIKDREKEVDYLLGSDYILSPKDLCSIDFIDDLIKVGINAFKIEGRMRSPDYAKVTTATYRKAIDAFYKGQLNESLKESLKEQLSMVYNRGFSQGFYFGRPQEDVSRRLEHLYERVFLGEVTRFFKKINVAEVYMRHGSLKKGDQILFFGKKTPACFTKADQLQRHHRFVARAKKGESVGIKLPFTVKPKDKVFLWKKRQ